MTKIGLVVPVLNNFKGFTELMESVDVPVLPIVIDNWNKNIGVSCGWNEGIRRAIKREIDVLLISNDDVVLMPGAIDNIIDSLPDYDLVSAAQIKDRRPTTGLIEGPADFSFFAIRPMEFVKKFGWFDQNFSPAYFEDNDMHYRILLAGGKTAMRFDAQMKHKGSVTQNSKKGGVVSSKMFEDNRAYYIRKWGAIPGDEEFKHPFNDVNMSIKNW